MYFFNETTINIIIIIAIIFIAFGYSAIAHFSYSFLHFILIFESMILAVCLIFSIGSISFDKIEGDIAVLFVVAIVAAETAIAISLYVRSTINPPVRFKKIFNKKSDKFYFNKKTNFTKKYFLLI